MTTIQQIANLFDQTICNNGIRNGSAYIIQLKAQQGICNKLLNKRQIINIEGEIVHVPFFVPCKWLLVCV